MTQEEYLRRMQNDKYKELKVTTKDAGEPYVFISYKSDSWEVVLTRIAYKLQKEYGLRVYFDKSFNDNNNLWTVQFPENMEHTNCKAVLAFIDNAYYLSYATLLELMYSQTFQAAIGVNDDGGLPVIPINLEIPVDPGVAGNQDTGLGVEIYPDGSRNPNAEEEKRVFDEAFSELKERGYFDKKAKFLYKGKSLSKNVCSTIMGELYKMLKVNDNPYRDVPEYYDSLVKTIKSVAPDVFCEISKPVVEPENNVIDWDEFDRIKAFSYKGTDYNVENAQQAYIALVDVICQEDATFDIGKIIDKSPVYVILENGKELSIPKKGYGSILRAGIGQKEIILYGESIENGKAAKEYKVLKREDTVPLTYNDTIEDFEYYFKKLKAEYKENWKKSGNTGNTPAINLELEICFNCDCLEYHKISGYSFTSMFVEMMEYFYQMSGERYYDYAVALCAEAGNKNPLIITEEFWNNGDVNKGVYSAIKGSSYLFYNWYGAPETLRAINRQIEMYMRFLQENGQKADLADVTVQYTFEERSIAKMMCEIREAGKSGKKGRKSGSTDGATTETVAFSAESFVGFIKRFKQISAKYKEAWKKENEGNTPPIPFSNIALHFPADVTKKTEVKGDNWKPLFNAVMDAFCEFTDGTFCEMRIEKELQKNIKTPGVVPKEFYTEQKIPCARYQPICDGKYYFFNSYGAPELIKAMEDEIRAYMNYLAVTKGNQEDIESVKISYELPVGYYADMFR